MQLLVINHIRVQGMNAVNGMTYGNVGIIPSLGFVHALERRLANHTEYNGLSLQGCAVAVHDVAIHSFRNDNHTLKFTQSRNPPALQGLSDDKKASTASVIEEGKMTSDVSLVIPFLGKLPFDKKQFYNWLTKQCFLQRFAGGSIQSIKSITHYRLTDNDEDKNSIRELVVSLLPSFMLYDKSQLLSDYATNNQLDTLSALMDFVQLRQTAHPKHDLIDEHLKESEIFPIWQNYLESNEAETTIPIEVVQYFATLTSNKKNKALLAQWESYVTPTSKTDADWRVLPKPSKGYLVPIMNGYKAISQLYNNTEIDNVRDNQTDVCFVEAVHTLGEWRSTHRIKDYHDLQQAIWCYHYEPNWYLCRQNYVASQTANSLANNSQANPQSQFSF